MDNADTVDTRTFIPPSRFGGSVTLSVSKRGLRSTPSASALTFSIGFFFAFMIFGRDVYRGSTGRSKAWVNASQLA